MENSKSRSPWTLHETISHSRLDNCCERFTICLLQLIKRENAKPSDDIPMNGDFSQRLRWFRKCLQNVHLMKMGSSPTYTSMQQSIHIHLPWTYILLGLQCMTAIFIFVWEIVASYTRPQICNRSLFPLPINLRNRLSPREVGNQVTTSPSMGVPTGQSSREKKMVRATSSTYNTRTTTWTVSPSMATKGMKYTQTSACTSRPTERGMKLTGKSNLMATGGCASNFRMQ